MSLVNGKCPLCGSEIRVPETQEKAFCPSCGKEIVTEAAVSYYSFTKNDAPAYFTKDSINQSKTVDDIKSDFATQTTPEHTNIDTQSTVTENINAPSVVTSVFLSNWKTSYGATIAGIISSLAMFTVLTVVGSINALGGVLYIVSYLAFIVMGIIYALVFYKSYFSDKPRLTSNGVVSFWNGFFGSFIFGCLWNSNLSNKKRGISHYVFAVGEILGAVLIVLSMASLTSILTTNAGLTGLAQQAAADQVDSKFAGTWIGYAVYSDKNEKVTQFDELGITMTIFIRMNGTGSISDNFGYASDMGISYFTLKHSSEKQAYEIYDANGNYFGVILWDDDSDNMPGILFSDGSNVIGLHKST